MFRQALGNLGEGAGFVSGAAMTVQHDYQGQSLRLVSSSLAWQRQSDRNLGASRRNPGVVFFYWDIPWGLAIAAGQGDQQEPQQEVERAMKWQSEHVFVSPDWEWFGAWAESLVWRNFTPFFAPYPLETSGDNPKLRDPQW